MNDDVSIESPGEWTVHFPDRHTVTCTLWGDPGSVTSACAAAGADAQRRGGVLHGGGGGLQHSLHVLMLSSILRVAQALWLAWGHRGTTGELARLQEQGGYGMR